MILFNLIHDCYDCFIEILTRTKSVDVYSKACQDLEVVPISSIYEILNGKTAVLRHRGIGAKGAQAIAQVLVVFNP